MTDAIQLRDIRTTSQDLPPPAYASYDNPSFANNGHRVRSRSTEPGSPTSIESGKYVGYANVGFSNAPNNNEHYESVDKPDGVYTISPGHGGRKPSHREEELPVYEDEEEDEDEDSGNCFTRCISRVQESIKDFYDDHKKIIWRIFYIILLLAYAGYFAYAMYYHFGDEGSIRLLWVTCFVVFCVIIWLFFKYFGESLGESLKPCLDFVREHDEAISWIAVILLFIAVIIFTIVDVAVLSEQPYNLVSATGIIVYILLLFIFSFNPAKVHWRPVVWGLGLQFCFALIILRWRGGYEAFKWLGDRVAEFLAHTDAGSEFIFGADFRIHFFAFAILPIVIFFSTAISMLYYMGAMQVLIKKIAFVMQAVMGTTAGESLNAAGNIFIGQSEAPLLIRPLIGKMTRSELHAVMTGGFATIAGTVLGAYISFGVPANHLLSASVMSAPAALAMAKLFYPETKKSKTTVKDIDSMEDSPQRNIIEAASSGASASIKLIANIAANLIAFIALLQFVNATLTWFGERVGIYDPPLTFELICSYVLWPFAVVMGVDLDRGGRDARNIAKLIGIKTFINEFVAYTNLGVLIDNRDKFSEHIAQNGTWRYTGDLSILLNGENGADDVVLIDGYISDRSEVIATYALCGFANIGSMGIMLGALGAMAPQRKADLSAIVLRAMIAGNVACFITACIAGLYYQP